MSQVSLGHILKQDRAYFKILASGYRYAKSHEWASTGDSNSTTIGISKYAQVKVVIGEWTYCKSFLTGQTR